MEHLLRRLVLRERIRLLIDGSIQFRKIEEAIRSIFGDAVDEVQEHHSGQAYRQKEPDGDGGEDWGYQDGMVYDPNDPYRDYSGLDYHHDGYGTFYETDDGIFVDLANAECCWTKCLRCNLVEQIPKVTRDKLQICNEVLIYPAPRLPDAAEGVQAREEHQDGQQSQSSPTPALTMGPMLGQWKQDAASVKALMELMEPPALMQRCSHCPRGGLHLYLRREENWILADVLGKDVGISVPLARVCGSPCSGDGNSALCEVSSGCASGHHSSRPDAFAATTTGSA